MPVIAGQAAAAPCDALYLCPCSVPQEILISSQHSDVQSSGAMQAGLMGGMNMDHASTFIEEILAHNTAGTSAEPNSTPHDMLMTQKGPWTIMFHGAGFLDSQQQTGPRGADKFYAPNWFMGAAEHSAGKGSFLFQLMLSLDPATVTGRSFPELFQTGETAFGKPLVDAQHPHNFIMAIGLNYARPVAENTVLQFYFAPVGDPALGPVAFPHRASAAELPQAPLGHHWQDSTHITFGVTTAGLQWRNVKVEGSVFTGREPDEVRYDFDRPRFDSFSGRVSWNPIANLALQVSHGYIKSPEALDPNTKVHRTTASAIYNQPLGHDTNWSTSFVWGQNNATQEGKTQSFLVETDYQRGRDTIYARWERVEKSAHELVLDLANESEIFPVSGYTIGYVRDLTHGQGLDVGLGGQFTLYDHPDALDPFYGDNLGYGFEFFLRIRPSLHEMK